MPIIGLKEANEQIMAGNATECSEAQLLLALLKYDGAGKYETGVAYCQAILDRFGGLNGLARARAEELTAFPGLGLGMVPIIKAALELGQRVQRGTADRTALTSSEAVYALVQDMRFLTQEEMRVLSLDTRNRLIRQDSPLAPWWHALAPSAWAPGKAAASKPAPLPTASPTTLQTCHPN